MSEGQWRGPEDGDFEPQYAQVVDVATRPYKAYFATVLSAVSVVVAYWIADEDPFTLKEAGEAALLALAASGLTGGGTYRVRNPKTVVSRSV